MKDSEIGSARSAFCETTEQHQRIYAELCSKIEIEVMAAVTTALVSGVVYASFHFII